MVYTPMYQMVYTPMYQMVYTYKKKYIIKYIFFSYRKEKEKGFRDIAFWESKSPSLFFSFICMVGGV